MESCSTFVMATSMSLVMLLMHVIYKIYLSVSPYCIKRMMQSQRIPGPNPMLLLGNMLDMKKFIDNAAVFRKKDVSPHHLEPRLFPYFVEWRKAYGKKFVFWLGSEPVLYLQEPKLIHQIISSRELDRGRPTFDKKASFSLLGNGLITAEGEDWIHQRRIVGHALNAEKVKGMLSWVIDATLPILNEWAVKIEHSAQSCAEIEVDGALDKITSQVICKLLFGTSYEKGFAILDKVTQIQESFFKYNRMFGVPGSRFLPTASNKMAWKLGAEADDLIMEEIKKRVEADNSRGFGEDMLGILLQEVYAKESPLNFTLQDVVDQCKTLLIAGQETTKASLTWTMMLLAMNPKWQDKVRDEVMHNLTNGDVPDMNMLHKLNNMTIVLKESMRLYPPVSYVMKQAKQDVELGNSGLKIPKGMSVWINILGMHQDPDLWGGEDEVYKFKPERFSTEESVLKKAGFIPFGFGARVCVGERLAQMEQKAILSMVLSKFAFTVSPNYTHSVTQMLTIKPTNGVQLLVSLR